MANRWLVESPNPWLKWVGLGVGGYNAAQFKYLALLAIATALAWICRRHGTSFDSFARFSSCRGAPDESVCFRKEAVLRISFATFIFFALHVVAIFVTAAIKGPDQEDVEKAVCALHAGVHVMLEHLPARCLQNIVFLASSLMAPIEV